MRYEDFKELWESTLRASRLGRHGFSEETLNSSTLDRRYSVRVAPPQGQDSRPFHVTAELSWRWSALHTARTVHSEEDAVTELLGLRSTQQTTQPWMRVDIVLSATLPYGEPIPMPAPKAWTEWAREVLGRLESIEPLLPEERTREASEGRIEALAWREEPEVEAKCAPDGQLQLAGVSLAAGVVLELPRQSDSDEHQDEDPEEALVDLFGRLEGALRAWSEVLDHLRPAGAPRT